MPPADVRLLEYGDALDHTGSAHRPASLGGRSRINGAQPAHDVWRLLIVGQRWLRQRQCVGEIESVGVSKAVLVTREPRALGERLLQHAYADCDPAPRLVHLIVAKQTVDRLAPGNAALGQGNALDRGLEFFRILGSNSGTYEYAPPDHREAWREPLVHEFHPPANAPALKRVIRHQLRTGKYLIDVFHDRGGFSEHEIPMLHRRN